MNQNKLGEEGPYSRAGTWKLGLKKIVGGMCLLACSPWLVQPLSYNQPRTACVGVALFLSHYLGKLPPRRTYRHFDRGSPSCHYFMSS